MYICRDIRIYLKTTHIYTHLPHTSIHAYVVYVYVCMHKHLYLYKHLSRNDAETLSSKNNHKNHQVIEKK